MTIKKYVAIAWLAAIIGESYANFVAQDTTKWIIIPIILSYFVFFVVVGKLSKILKLRPISTTLLGGILGVTIVEWIFMHNLNLNWLLQIYMFSYWSSISAVPFIIEDKKYLVFILPAGVALSLGSLLYLTKNNSQLSLYLFEVVFWIVFATTSYILLSKNRPKQSIWQ